ncbi:MAG: Type 4 prepilin-like protein leader peptide-processing enzyme [Microgenomates group bacterium GW2011_GWA2_47_8]|nr:MAG: Type 4 prepilin-like protein leader peptide-processing enzyme [Microgenomates group bacterium GW2011_GWA2_47_8]
MVVPHWVYVLSIKHTTVFAPSTGFLAVCRRLFDHDFFCRSALWRYSGVLAFLGLWIGTKKRGMGLGDVKFVFPLGLILGWPNMAVGLFLSFVIGAVTGVALIAFKKKKFRQTVPFGPFLVVGSAITLVFGDQMLRWYLSFL